MGCGSSSLKGDAPTGVDSAANDPAPRPLKKVATNFSTVNYDNTTQKRRNTEYAPHETERQPSAISEVVEQANAGVEPKPDPGPGVAGGEELKPYRTIEGDEPLDPSEAAPVANGVSSSGGDAVDPTSAAAKNEFATDNDPANPAHQVPNGTSAATYAADPSNPSEVGQAEGKKSSWLGKKYKTYADARDHRNTSIPDEDLEKYTGKTRAEIDELREKGEGVGGGQMAGTVWTTGTGGAAAETVGVYSGSGR